MNQFGRASLIVAAAFFAICAVAAPSYADTQQVSGCGLACNGYSFQATLTAITPSASNGESNYSLSYTITDVSNSTPANAQSFSLTLFQSTNTVDSVSGLTVNGVSDPSYAVAGGKSNNGNNNCSASVGNAVCVASTGKGPLSEVSQGNPLTFSFDLKCTDCTELANWIFLSQGKSLSGSGNVYAISAAGHPVSMPEPSTPILLFCSLLAALGILAIPRVRSVVFSEQWREVDSLTRI
ncbi:MAG: hypothetical protein JWQ87_3217 [Candidatus Sulfotelmatobacter sp.]|nr:hypothetical protein [Candidatus Sulfotelmatobacter sp.]